MDFEKGWELGDVTFEVGSKKVYVNKGALCMSSKVFTTMFTSEFKEKHSTTIPLPGKKFEDVLLFAKAIHPPFIEINDDNADILLPLAHEYEVTHILRMCEKHMMTKPPSIKSLIRADQYMLSELRNLCLEALKETRLCELVDDKDFKGVSRDTVRDLIKLQAENPREVSAELIKELTSKPPSIRGLRLAEKYHIGELFNTCMQYVIDTPLITLENEPDFKLLDLDTKITVLKMKVTSLEIDFCGSRLTKEKYEKQLNMINDLVNYRKLTHVEPENGAKGGVPQDGAKGQGRRNRWDNTGDGGDGPFCGGYGSMPRHKTGTKKSCGRCTSHILSEIHKVSTVEKHTGPPNTSYTGGVEFLLPTFISCHGGKMPKK